MRIDRTTLDHNLLSVLQGLFSCGAVIEVLTSDGELWIATTRRKPTVVYRPSMDSPDHVWLQCPEISSEEFDLAMDYFNTHWAELKSDPVWSKWLSVHPIPADVVAA